MGKDVAPEVILDTVRQEQVSLVGLSALMTTTLSAWSRPFDCCMIKRLKPRSLSAARFLTQEYADSIGADCYAKDAMATVHYADQVFG